MRIAVHDKDRCKPSECNYLCIRVCPVNKTGGECIVKEAVTGMPRFSEILCTGCGICVKKCPFNAIKIINLPQALEDPVHQFGVNGFRLFNLPMPRPGIVGIVGSNGIGKTSALKMISGEIIPNLGSDAGWDEIIDRFRGHEISEYLERLSKGEVKVSFKPQYVESIPKVVKGTVGEIIERVDERGVSKELIGMLHLGSCLEKDITEISGGELQRVALSACILKDADVYLIDEPSSYLDVSERLNMARAVRSLSDKIVFVVEHDLVTLDYLSDQVHVIFGEKGGYGIISNIMGTRAGINEYLSGFLKSENMRFRNPIKFDVKPPSSSKKTSNLLDYPKMRKTFSRFTLDVDAGSIKTPKILGILGPNATGKTTFMKMLAGVEYPDEGALELNVKISYKPQYIQVSDRLVASLSIHPEHIERFRLQMILGKRIDQLSGGELQRVAIADCLSKDAQIFLLDEPSAYLDVEERISLAKYIHSFGYDKKVSVLVIEHDILLVDYLSDELYVFSGTAGVDGHASGPHHMRDGMNMFLKKMDVTFRRDQETGRPRANKADSVKDRHQRNNGQFYYSEE